MFVKIYSAIACLIVSYSAVAYFIYQYQYEHRLQQHSEGILRGSLMLIAEGYQRQKNDKREAWLTLIKKLSGFRFIIEEADTAHFNQWQISLIERGGVQIELKHLRQVIRLSVESLSERHYRSIALLIYNELARQPKEAMVTVLSRLAPLYPFELSIISHKQYALDKQQSRRLENGEVVVAYSEHENTASVYFKVSKNQILAIGPIDAFVPISQELALSLFFIGLLLVLFMTYYLVRGLENRLAIVTSTLDSYGPNKMQKRVPITGNDRITRLGIRVNQMADRIESLLEHQKELNQAVSHELRTPIARIKFRSQLLSDELNALDSTSKREMQQKLDGMGQDIKQLESLIDEILSFQKLDATTVNKTMVTFDIASLLDEVVMAQKLNQTAIKLTTSIPDKVLVYGSLMDVSRLLENLVGNAFKYTQDEVIITLEDNDKAVVIIVEDNGPGVAMDDREKIFNPFARLDNALEKQGYGLGLAIASRIAKLHKGQIKVATSALGGARFSYTMPRK